MPKATDELTPQELRQIRVTALSHAVSVFNAMAPTTNTDLPEVKASELGEAVFVIASMFESYIFGESKNETN